MEDKKYEAGRVEISSAEYRDLVKEACEARRDASEMRSEKWKLEDEIKKYKEELANANKKIEELESMIRNLQTYGSSNPAANTPPWWSQLTCVTNIKKEDD